MPASAKREDAEGANSVSRTVVLPQRPKEDENIGHRTTRRF